MKKSLKIVSLFLVVVSFGLILTGCGKKDTSESMVKLKLNTEGLGQVSYYVNNINKKGFNDEYPNQSLYTRLKKGSKVTIDAKADDGWKFIKWTKDGKEYSKDSKLNITISEDSELIAVFEIN